MKSRTLFRMRDPTFVAAVDPHSGKAYEDDDWIRCHGADRVYFVRAPKLRLIKIGYTTDLRKRLEQFRSDFPFDTSLIGVIYGGRLVERVMHERFGSYRVRGEWFDDTALPGIIDVLVEDAEWRGKLEFAMYLQKGKI